MQDVWEEYYKNLDNILNMMWVFKVKENCHGEPVKYKACLCIQGFNQVLGIDYNETWAPTGKIGSLRLASVYALKEKMKITQFNVKGAFLHAPLEEIVIIRTPEGSSRKSPYLKLKKSLYGLKQSPKNWYETLTLWIKSQGYKESTSNPCLYLKRNTKEILYFHVDDLIHVGNSNTFKSNFLSQFQNSSCHPPNTILGMLMEIKDNQILLSQPNHIDCGLEELSLSSCKDTMSPLTQNLNLKPASDDGHAEFCQLNINYWSEIGLLNHISQYTCPDVSFSVSSLARFNSKPGMSHWQEVRKVWKYLKTTKDFKLIIKYNPKQDILSSFSNATWADNPTFQKSQTGYIVFHYGSPVIWNSTRQQNITYSSTESELNALLD